MLSLNLQVAGFSLIALRFQYISGNFGSVARLASRHQVSVEQKNSTRRVLAKYYFDVGGHRRGHISKSEEYFIGALRLTSNAERQSVVALLLALAAVLRRVRPRRQAWTKRQKEVSIS